MTIPPTRRPGELAFGIVLVIFSTACLWQAFEISGFAGLSEAGVFPMLAAASMLVSALFILRDTARLSAVAGDEKPFFAEICPTRLIVMTGLVLLYLVVMPWLGFVVASSAFLFASIAYLWHRNIIWSLLVSLVSISMIYVVFRMVFQVVLPKGTLFPGLF